MVEETTMAQSEFRSTEIGAPIPPQYQEAIAKPNSPAPENVPRRPVPNQAQPVNAPHDQGSYSDEQFRHAPGSSPPIAGEWNQSNAGGSPSRANVVPLSLVERRSATVECPVCRQLTQTNTKHKAGKGTHWMATLLFFTTGIGAPIPYMTNFSKNVRHDCYKCGSKLATHHFGSGTETHLI